MNNIWYDHFLKALYDKQPKRSKLTEALMDLLSIEREAVYRRLRKEVAFSIYDIAKIARAWNISIDSIFGIVSDKSHLFQMDMLPYNAPFIGDLEATKKYFHFLEMLISSEQSEYIEISYSFPESLLENYPALSKFHTFKWMYQYGSEKDIPSFTQLVLPEEAINMEKKYCNSIKRIKHLSYIWDNLVVQYLINDILYFRSIYLLSEEDVQLLKQEINMFLNEMEQLSIQGEFPETHSKVELYISQINVDTNYCYYSSPSVKACGLVAFVKNLAISQNESVCENFKKWMHTQKRISIPITQVNERHRIEFFKQQREILDRI